MASDGHLKVRMYDVGFGDAFLVAMTDANQSWRMLVDCGKHPSATSGHALDSVVADIISACTHDNGRPRIDVVVASNGGVEHISGFADERWQSVEVGEVWLPWVADPRDPEATRLRQKLGSSDPAGERAWWTLRHGFLGSPARQFGAVDGLRRRDAPALPGAVVHFLGPSRDSAAYAAMDAASGHAVSTQASPPPFAESFLVAPKDYAARHPALSPPDRLLDSLTAQPGNPLAAVARRDRAVANTSLVFVLQVGQAVLLFPGDARQEVWSELLADPDLRDLLSRVRVYKVSHHGSRAGNPGAFLNVLPPTAISLLSVGTLEPTADFPNGEVVEALRSSGSLLMTASRSEAGTGISTRPDGLWTEVSVPT